LDCYRLRQPCKYELARAPSFGATPALSPRLEIFLGTGAFTPSHLKDAIIHKLEPLTPQDAFSSYYRSIEPWFPILSISKLRGRLPQAWDEAGLDVTLLCLSITLLTTPPPTSTNDENDPSEFTSLYLYTKNSIASTEGFGINSLLIIQARILVILFELAHGFYPGAYISIGATVRAADALEVHPGTEILSSNSSDDGTKREEMVLAWTGMLILDRWVPTVEGSAYILTGSRYIAVDSGPHPSLTQSRSESLHDMLKPTVCLTHERDQDRTSPICRFALFFEASSLLDKFHTTLNCPVGEKAFNMEELVLTVQTTINLQTIVNEDIGNGMHIYAAGFALCNT
jgi:hypothetical protein